MKEENRCVYEAFNLSFLKSMRKQHFDLSSLDQKKWLSLLDRESCE